MGLLFDAAMAWDKLSNATYDIDVAKNRKVHHIKLSLLTESWLVKNIWKTERDINLETTLENEFDIASFDYKKAVGYCKIKADYIIRDRISDDIQASKVWF